MFDHILHWGGWPCCPFFSFALFFFSRVWELPHWPTKGEGQILSMYDTTICGSVFWENPDADTFSLACWYRDNHMILVGSVSLLISVFLVFFPCRMLFLFARENAPRRNRREVSKLEERHMLTKEFSHVCVCRKEKNDAAASTWAKDPQAPKKINFQEKICGNGG